jgi:phage baseplate assembly protein W
MFEGQYGKGLIFPFQENGQGDYLQGEGETLLNSDITLLLGCSKGELLWDTERGTRLVEILHRSYSADAVEALVLHMVSETMNKYESRVRLSNIRAEKKDKKLKLFTTYRPLGYSSNAPGATVEQEIVK